LKTAEKLERERVAGFQASGKKKKKRYIGLAMKNAEEKNTKKKRMGA